jgi:hypothetical protein
MRRLAVLLVLLACVACGGSSPKATTASVCGDFRSLVKDLNENNLTGKQLTSKSAQLADRAGDAAAPISLAAQHLSDAADKSDSSSVVAAADEFDSACQAAGQPAADLTGGTTSKTFSCTASAIASPDSVEC